MMAAISVARIGNLRRMDDSVLVNEDSSDDFLVACESQFILHEEWGGLTHVHYALFLAQYCQNSPGEACQQQASNFWDLDLRFQKLFMSAGCPEDAEQNEQCIDYFLQNNPHTLMYTGNVTQLCELTEDLLITTGVMEPVYGDSNPEQQGRDSGNPPIDMSVTSTELPSFAPTQKSPELPKFDPIGSQENDEKDLVSPHVITFLIFLVVSGLCLGMSFANIRRLRNKRRKAPIDENNKDFVHGEDRPRIPRVSSSAVEDESSILSSCSWKKDLPRPSPINSAAGMFSLSHMKHTTVNDAMFGGRAQPADDEESSIPSQSGRENTRTHMSLTEGVWIVECTEEEEEARSAFAASPCKLNAQSIVEHCPLIEVPEACEASGAVSKRSIGIDSMNVEDLNERRGSMDSISLGHELQSTTTFDYSIRNGQERNIAASNSPALCELVDLVHGTSPSNSDYIQSLTDQSLDPSKQDDISSTVQVHTEDESYAKADRVRGGRVETAAVASMSEHKQSFIVLCDSIAENDPSGHDDYSSTASADKSEESSLRATIRRNAKATEISQKSSRTGADPPDDDDAAMGRQDARISIDAQNPISHQAKLSQSSDFDGMSTSATSCSSELSTDTCSAKPNTQLHPLFDSDNMHSGIISNSGNWSIVSSSTYPQAKISPLLNLDIVSTGDQSEHSMRRWSGNNRRLSQRLPISDEISVDSTSDTSRHSFAQVHANSEAMLLQESDFDDISTDIQSCSSQLSFEGGVTWPRGKSKRLSRLEGMSMDALSYSTEWSMESSMRQTFDSFKQNISHAIAELNDDMHTVDTTPSLRDSDTIEGNKAIHRICALDP